MIVVDSAAVVDALTLAPDSDALRDQLADEELHAPSLLDYEVTSALRGLVLGGHLGPSRAEDCLTDFDDLPIRRWSSEDALRRRALHLRDILSTYDAAYVALAEALECPLLTRDARLSRSRGHAAEIRLG